MKETTPMIFRPDYLLQELFSLLKNNLEAAPRLIENLMNVDYDFENSTGLYNILNQEQCDMLHNIHLRRKQDRNFDFQVQKILLIAGGIVGIFYGVAKLTEEFSS